MFYDYPDSFFFQNILYLAIKQDFGKLHSQQVGDTVTK